MCDRDERSAKANCKLKRAKAPRQIPISRRAGMRGEGQVEGLSAPVGTS